MDCVNWTPAVYHDLLSRGDEANIKHSSSATSGSLSDATSNAMSRSGVSDAASSVKHAASSTTSGMGLAVRAPQVCSKLSVLYKQQQQQRSDMLPHCV